MSLCLLDVLLDIHVAIMTDPTLHTGKMSTLNHNSVALARETWVPTEP